MATLHFRNAKVFVDGFELSGDHNEVAVNYSVELLDETAFGDSTRINKGGLTVVSVDGKGHWNAAAGTVDRILFDIVGSDDKIVTVFANGITEGTTTDKGFAMKGVLESYNLSGASARCSGSTTRCKAEGLKHDADQTRMVRRIGRAAFAINGARIERRPGRIEVRW